MFGSVVFLQYDVEGERVVQVSAFHFLSDSKYSVEAKDAKLPSYPTIRSAGNRAFQ